MLQKSFEKLTLNLYSTLGIRAECDFMIWRVSEKLELFERMTYEIMNSGIGPYISLNHSFLSMTKHSQYVSKNKNVDQEGTRIKIKPKKRKYLIVYPFVKKVEWYLLSQKQRQKMMSEHIGTGHRLSLIHI